MTDQVQVRGFGGAVARRRVVLGVEDSGPFPGRHASRNEIAAETPIFHSLTVGGWRSRQHEPAAPARPARRTVDPASEFRQDPLTAPFPVQSLPAAAGPAMSSRSLAGPRGGTHALPETGIEDSGRHHRYAAAVRVGIGFGW